MKKTVVYSRLMVLLGALLTFCFMPVFASELIDVEQTSPQELPSSQNRAKAEKKFVPLEGRVDKKVEQKEPFVLLGQSIAPGTMKQLSLSATLSSIKFNIPVLIAHGNKRGPVVCLTAALHGDELNGIEIARQVLHGIDPTKLAGTLVAMPIVNIEGFLKQSRYIADRRDLNRYFPGDPKGVTPARFAYQIFNSIILKSDALIDLHTGSYYRSNLPQLRADLANDTVAEMVEKFGSLTVLNSPGAPGMLRNAAVDAGIPAVTMEVGGPLSLNKDDVDFGVKAIRSFLGDLEMIKSPYFFRDPQPIFYKSKWLLAGSSGILLVEAKLGQAVRENQQIAQIINPITNEVEKVLTPFSGTILGVAQNQFVNPGFMIFRIGIKTSEEKLRDAAVKEKKAQDAKQ